MGRHRYYDSHRLQHLSTVSLIVGSVLAVAAGLALPSMTSQTGSSGGQLAADTQKNTVADGVAPQGIVPAIGAEPRVPAAEPSPTPTPKPTKTPKKTPSPAKPNNDGGGSNGGGSSGGGSNDGGSSGGGGGSTQGDSAPQSTLDGFPSASNTGWQHTGVTLTAYTGSMTITQDGAVIDGKDVNGCLNVKADNVTIKRSRIRCHDYFPVWIEGDTGLQVIDTEIDGTGENKVICIASENYTALRVNCHGMGDGPRLGDNTNVVDSYVHGLVSCGECHTDGMQSVGGVGIVVRHNTVENPFNQTSCIIIKPDFGPLRDVLIEDNLFNGGGYTVYGGTSDSSVDHIRYLNNRFRRGANGFWPNGGYFGPVADFDKSRPGNQWSGNVWDDNGATINP